MMTEKQKQDFVQFFENTIELIDSLDENSFNFRYPEDKQLEQSIKRDYWGIDCLRLKKVIDAIDEQMMGSYEYSWLGYKENSK